MTGVFWGSQLDFPSGTIIPWSKKASKAPAGWVFCDGNNGTPDLRNKYAKSVPDSSTDPGSTGGSHSITLSESQMPSHSHPISSSSVSDHSHGLDIEAISYTSDYDDQTDASYFVDNGPETYNFDSDGNHSHSITTGSTGGGSSIDNEPAYQTMTHIMKL